MGKNPALRCQEGERMSTERHRRYCNKSGRESQDTFADFLKLVLFELAFITVCMLWIFSK